MKRTVLILMVLAVALAPANAIEKPDKHRLVVMTDIGGDPDDQQSMVRFLLYSCDFDVEGFCTGFGPVISRNTGPTIHQPSVLWP